MSDFTVGISQDNKTVKISFSAASLCSAVARFEFCSRLLYGSKPNTAGVWENSNEPRVDAHILGFPKHIEWSRPDANILYGNSNATLTLEYVEELKKAIYGIKGNKDNQFQKVQYSFSIMKNDTNQVYQYRFHNRSRAVVAFSVLWDQAVHPRDHMEVQRASSLKYLVDYPKKDGLEGTRTYGDPSKTVDELRNEGFPRDTDQSPRGISIHVTRANRYDNLQEHYQLQKREQSFPDQVGRSQIPERFKRLLYAESEYTCNNCGEVFEGQYLAPDHRVPSIVEADNLSEYNYMQVLQTLCVRCNQVKREACKKCPYMHNCSKCAWAYPEKHGISKKSVYLLRAEAELEGLTINELVASYFTPDK